MKSSAVLQSSKRARAERRPRLQTSVAPEAAVVACCLVLLSVAATWWFYAHGYTLYYGDAEAHLNGARRYLDSRTPGYGQVGTVWLPLPHVLMLPLIMSDGFWRSGLAGAIPIGACFVFAVVALYLTVRHAFESRAAAITAAALFALNPNILYLQSIPMTEMVFFAGLFGMLYATVWYHRTRSTAAVIIAALFSIWASLTRYEGWFLIPFVALFFAVAARRWRPAILFAALASLAPIYWLVHNACYYGDPLEFYRGQYSPMAIQHGATYPGNHDWRVAWLYFRTAVAVVCAKPLMWIGVAGILVALLRRAWWPAVFLALPPLFYVWSMHSSGGSPIYIPQLPPHSYYNSRYATAAMPLLALGGAALVTLLPRIARPFGVVAIVVVAAAPWLLHPTRESWICWKESQVNSEARRAWISETARYIGAEYRTGQGIFTTVGDMAAVYRIAGIPLRETLNESTDWMWNIRIIAPDVFVIERWAIAFAGDPVSAALARGSSRGLRYDLVKRIRVEGARAIEIYRRHSADPLHEGARIEE